MKFVPKAVSRTVGRQILVARKNSPTILFATGVVGVVATTVMASKATLKLEGVMSTNKENLQLARDLHDEKYTEQDRQRDIAVLYGRAFRDLVKLYGPTAVVGVLSIVCLTKSHRILTNRNTNLMAAYIALEQGFSQYRARVVNEFGEDKDRELRYGMETREIIEESKTGHKIKNVTGVGSNGASIYARFFDRENQNWEPTGEYNYFFLKAQQNYLNDKLRARGHVFLNDAYDSLGMDRSSAGAVVGWVWPRGVDNDIDFGIFDKGSMDRFHDFVTGREGCILLDFNVDGVIYDKI
jgi:Family of unknown function (DUF6353)